MTRQFPSRYKVLLIVSTLIGASSFLLPLTQANSILGDALGFNSTQKELLVPYVSQNQDYTFQHPVSWVVYEKPDGVFPYVRISNFDHRTRSTLNDKYFKVEIVTLPNKNNFSLSEWVENLITTSHPLPKVIEHKNIEVGGVSAIYQLEQVGSLVHPVVYIQKEERIYLINVSRADEKLKSVVEDIINSFQFNP